jgi:hypothetical protein
MTTTIDPGETVPQDPQAEVMYEFNFDTSHLPLGVEIIDYDLNLATLRGDDGLVISNDVLASGNRRVQFIGKTPVKDATYEVTCHIVTNEVPAQRDDISFRIVGRHR